ncbi:MAG: GGDEF domain-containing protein [Cyanobacteria bacterium J06626_18]
MAQWQVETAREAAQLIASETPEIILLQASQKDNWEFCHLLKRQRRLIWSYCILLDRRSCSSENTATDVLLRQNRLVTTALEAGADAYLWVPDTLLEEPQETADYLGRLIQAHVRTALRRITASKELSQTNDLLSAIALVDPLTQLANRRAFDWELPRQIEAARMQNYSLSLLMLDIDHFKGVNDKHGHLIGDQVLRMCAERLRHHMRFYETPFRYGGEEFIVILQNTSIQEAQKTAERLRCLINDAPFVISSDLDLSLSVSIGVSTLEATDDAKGIDAIARADANLLKAKSAGRNQVIAS